MIEGDRNRGGKFTPGQELTAWQLNRVGETASRGGTIFSSNVDTIQGPFGTVFGDRSIVKAGIQYDYPFKCIIGYTNDGLEVKVRPGTVNNRMPKLSGSYLDATVTQALQITSAGTWDILIKATKTTTTFFPDTVIIDAKKRDTYADDDGNGYLVVATLTVTGTAPLLNITSFNQIVYASQVVVRTKPGTITAVWTWTSR